MKYQVNINGIDVEADFDDRAVDGIFRPLLHKLSEIRKSKERRILVMLAAPPGAGKSTLVSFLEYLAKETIPEYKVRAIGMDGFQRRHAHRHRCQKQIRGNLRLQRSHSGRLWCRSAKS